MTNSNNKYRGKFNMEIVKNLYPETDGDAKAMKFQVGNKTCEIAKQDFNSIVLLWKTEERNQNENEVNVNKEKIRLSWNTAALINLQIKEQAEKETMNNKYFTDMNEQFDNLCWAFFYVTFDNSRC